MILVFWTIGIVPIVLSALFSTGFTMSLNDLVSALQSNQITAAEFQELAAPFLQPAPAVKPLKLKVSEKGALSVYGLNNQWPTTLYPEQWRRLLDHADSIRAFITAHESEFSVKK